MRTKRTKLFFRALALCLCFCMASLPLMGMAAGGDALDSGAPESAQAGTLPEGSEAPSLLGYRPGHGGGKPDKPCDPEPVCNCEIKCETAAPNGDCPVCSADVGGCTGKAPTPAPVCSCEVKCEAAAPNGDCPVCSADVGGCTGKVPTPAPVCSCETKCEAAAPNTACPVCSADVGGCAGKAPTPAPVCSCETKCMTGKPDTACPVCAADVTGCKGEAPAPKFSIRILPPDGWYTGKASVTIRVTDENETGWKKTEAKIEKNGAWTDLTDELAERGSAKVEISENCTIYVTVTDQGGKTHAKSAYIECFDRQAPTLRAGIDGNLLRVEASDDLSGVAYIYINGYRFTGIVNGTLDVNLKRYADEFEQMSVVAVDNAGNKSKTVQVKNPYYGKDDKDNKDDDDKDSHDGRCPDDCDCRKTDAPVTTPTPTPTTPTPTTPSGSTTTKPSASGGGQSSTPSATTKPDTVDKDDAGEEVTPEPGMDFTENGNAVTRDLLYDKHTNKQFITVQDRDGNTFYIIIDYDKPLDEEGDQYETYFLNLVDAADLAALAEDGGKEAACACTDQCVVGAINTACPVCAANMSECAGKAAVPDVTPAPDAEPDTPDEPEEKSGGSPILIILVVLLLAGGGAVYYLKFRKKKPDTKGPADLDDYDYGEDEEEYETEDDAEQADAGDTEDESL